MIILFNLLKLTKNNLKQIINVIDEQKIEKIKKFLPGGSSSGGKQAILVLIILGFVWLASGLYRVLPDEQGVVLRFGKFVNTTQPGLHYHFPTPSYKAVIIKLSA